MAYDDIDQPPLYSAVLQTWEEVTAEGPNGAPIDEIGLRAWAKISTAERLDNLPGLLGCYVSRVFAEQEAQRLDEAAADRTHTYLDDHDTASAWDSAMGHPDHHGDVEVSRAVLISILSELELLQHRLAMRDQEAAA